MTKRYQRTGAVWFEDIDLGGPLMADVEASFLDLQEEKAERRRHWIDEGQAQVGRLGA